jgi:DNA-binding MarR family transcriptional regulator
MHMQSSGPGDGVGAEWAKVAAFASAVDAGLDRWLSDAYRVGLTEFRALAFVSRSPEKELRVNDLAQRVGLNQSSATRLVSRLEAKGLAYRDVCMEDGRGVYAVITEKGEDLLREAREPYEARVRELLRETSARAQFDARRLTRALGTIGAIIES